MWIIIAGIILIFNYFTVDLIDPYVITIIIYSGINIVLAVSLNLINGFTGQFSLGHIGFMAIGAYTSAYLSSLIQSFYPEAFDNFYLTYILFFILLYISGCVSSIAGFIIGLPTLRLRGDYLAIVTLGFSEIIRVLLLNIDTLGGARGMTNIPGISNFSIVYLFALFVVFFIARLLKSPHGRELLAVREDEHAAESCGVDTTHAKIKAFVLGSFFAGVAGSLFAHYLRYLNPAIFDITKSFEVIIMVVLGGMGSLSGSVIAAVLLTVLKEALRPLQQITGTDYRMVIYSVLLIVLMLTRPKGIFGDSEITDYLPFFRKRKK